jgi:hypothetical protein
MGLAHLHGHRPGGLPHMPGAFSQSSATATTLMRVSGPLPTSMAPRTGSSTRPLRMM